MKAKLSIESPLAIGNNGIVIKIANNSDRLVGNLQVGRATVQWRKVRGRAGSEKRIPLEKLIDFLESQP